LDVNHYELILFGNKLHKICFHCKIFVFPNCLSRHLSDPTSRKVEHLRHDSVTRLLNL